MKRTFGVALILIALYFLFFDGRLKLFLHSRPAQAGVGIVSGIMGGMFAMPGPPVVLYCIGVIEDKQRYITTLQAFSVIFNIFYTLFRARVGFFGENTLLWWGIGLIGLVIGAWLGSLCFERISRILLKRIVYIIMLISGAVAIF